MMCSAIAEI